ncbi:hypothetical protein [Streptosporangium roseum]|uniref:hypothetical protein n=1 Tax=Streptosporangium roseum TaxID=2001 RepID=UPI0003012557|nr:hypothetical protein [Streptosporangium roseum]
MSFEEKRAWIYAVVAVGVPLAYFATVLGRVQAVGVTEVAYVRPMLIAIGVVAALGLTLADYENFWIANALYLAFVLDALTSSVTKIVAYRRGL